jgi:hypothetical protein
MDDNLLQQLQAAMAGGGGGAAGPSGRSMDGMRRMIQSSAGGAPVSPTDSRGIPPDMGGAGAMMQQSPGPQSMPGAGVPDVGMQSMPGAPPDMQSMPGADMLSLGAGGPAPNEQAMQQIMQNTQGIGNPGMQSMPGADPRRLMLARMLMAGRGRGQRK